MVYLLLLIIIMAAIVFIAIAVKNKEVKVASFDIKQKTVLTKNEQPTWWVLNDACKELDLVALAQVSFSAFLATDLKNRGRIAQKRVDFLVCRKSFKPVAVIEIDDSSHKGKEDKDADRDQLLKRAGIAVFRYKGTPSREQLTQDVIKINKNDMA
jgi:very-short-patch-repair endonuclease